MRILYRPSKVHNFDGHLLTQQLIIAQIHRAEPAFAELALDVDEFHSDLVVERLAWKINEGISRKRKVVTYRESSIGIISLGMTPLCLYY